MLNIGGILKVVENLKCWLQPQLWRCEETLLPPRANGSRLPRETRSWKTENERFRRLLSLEYCAGFAFGWKIAG
ncbi:hypothetical protein P5673_005734 [Acropora cervicornis]|uniref:Uncharacterized protein n=1 Tax=Acropora cervicornis TaxID=6130 RepID=A0AAD9QYJ9_ACRCE|nr:hypothetical protein P5673_005734 [Acropora cervicornis]